MKARKGSNGNSWRIAEDVHSTPRCPRAQDPEDAIEHTTVVNPRDATRLVRQQGLDGNPFIIGEFVARDSSPSFEAWITGVWPAAMLPGRSRLDAYGVEADISQRLISAETVESDPERTFGSFVTRPRLD